MIEEFIGTKSWKKILKRLKQKVYIFIETKNLTRKNKNKMALRYIVASLVFFFIAISTIQ